MLPRREVTSWGSKRMWLRSKFPPYWRHCWLEDDGGHFPGNASAGSAATASWSTSKRDPEIVEGLLVWTACLVMNLTPDSKHINHDLQT